MKLAVVVLPLGPGTTLFYSTPDPNIMSAPKIIVGRCWRKEGESGSWVILTARRAQDPIYDLSVEGGEGAYLLLEAQPDWADLEDQLLAGGVWHAYDTSFMPAWLAAELS